MIKRNEIYPIEKKAEKLIETITNFIKKGGNYLFNPPKDAGERVMWIIEFTAWVLLGISLVLRLGK